jgi:hypothetical protein
MNNIKLRYIRIPLKSRGPKIDPWGTPFWMSDQLLRIPLILSSLHFRFRFQSVYSINHVRYAQARDNIY